MCGAKEITCYNGFYFPWLPNIPINSFSLKFLIFLTLISSDFSNTSICSWSIEITRVIQWMQNFDKK